MRTELGQAGRHSLGRMIFLQVLPNIYLFESGADCRGCAFSPAIFTSDWGLPPSFGINQDLLRESPESGNSEFVDGKVGRRCIVSRWILLCGGESKQRLPNFRRTGPLLFFAIDTVMLVLYSWGPV